MILLQNVLMGIFAVFSLFTAYSFFMREKEIGIIRIYVLALGVGCFLCNAGYLMMSVLPVGTYSIIFRNIGLFGISFYIYMGVRIALTYVDMDVELRRFINYPLIFVFALSFLLHSLPASVDFVTDEGGFTSFITKRHIGYYMQIFYAILCSFLAINLFIMWYKQEISKRGRSFVMMIIAATLFFSLSSLPYFLGVKTSHPAFLYCLGGFGAFVVVWYAGLGRSAMTITMSSLGRDVFGAMNIGLLVFDIKSKLIIRNDYIRDRLKVYEVAGQSVADLFDISREEYLELKEELLKNGRIEHRCNGRFGENRYQLNSVVKYDGHGEPLCFIVSVLDVTEEEKMVQEIIKATNAKSEFLTSMSHEIRTPINAVLGMNELILRESSQADIIGYAGNIEASGRLLLSIVNDILDFSKIESGKMTIIPVEYDLVSVVADVVSMITDRAQKKGLELITDIDETLPRGLRGDELRIRQIIMNLLTNAVKYTDEGSVSLTVTGKMYPENRMSLEIAVTDTGKGIREEDIDFLFNPFQRLEQINNRNIEGTGLGLTLTKSFVEQMGGNINVESTVGVGTTFVVDIIQDITDMEPVGDIRERVRELHSVVIRSGAGIWAENVRILVTDDLEVNCDVIAGFLKGTGAVVESALSGKEAIELCRNTKYDLIFMDHMMPEIDGIDAQNIIRNDTINSDTLIVVLTANTVSGVEEMYLKSGFDAYLSKPVMPMQLEKCLLDMLPKRVRRKSDEELKEQREAYLKAQTSNDTTVSESNGIYDEQLETVKRLNSSVPGIDAYDAIEKYAGDPVFYLEMLDSFVRNERVRKMSQNYLDNDLKEYRLNAHTLKGMARSVGLYELEKMFESLQLACDNGDFEYIKSHHGEMVTLYGKVVDIIVRITT